jgi:D-alanyl-D-alanine carboxypeptidase (penicillin-binding protein 5/6)
VSSPIRGHLATPLAGLAAVLALASTAACSTAAAAPAAHQAPAAHRTPAAHQAPTAHRAPASGQSAPATTPTVGGSGLAGTGISVNYPASGARKLPRVPASAYVIADANTGQVLAAKDAHGRFPPASTLKMLTAITLIPLLNPDATVLATKRATSVEPNVVGLIAGHRYQVDDLFRALLLISANDAAVALTQATGSFDHGMAMINSEAHRLQAYDVSAKQPNGLPAAGQYVSAYDEALIARRALAIPAFMKYDSTRAARFQVRKRKWVTLVNQNTLLTQYEGGIGGKIGWTVKSKATYIGMARRNGVTLIVTVLHCAPLQEIKSGERLLNWGFAMAGQVKPVGQLVQPLPAVAASHQDARGHPIARHSATGNAQLASGPTSTGALPAALIAIAAGLLAAAAAAFGRLAWSRRRSAGPGEPPPP